MSNAESPASTAMSEHDETQTLGGEDRQLVDLVNKVLVDPNLHTDLRLRLAREITELVRAAHPGIYGPGGSEAHPRALEAHGDQVPRLLEAVLVDPNLHTDERMRLHRELSAICGKLTSSVPPVQRRAAPPEPPSGKMWCG
jgi:hypothetical protein